VERALLVGKVHQDLGALAGLEVLEGDAFGVARIETDVLDVLRAGGADVDLAEARPHGGG
jgi:hypothetical protein